MQEGSHKEYGLRRPRIDSLDALRGICALSVALFHFHSTGTLTNTPFIRNSWMLVDFFFVLSGFVITAAYADDLRKGYSIGRFLLLRLARIWPLHFVMLLCFVALELTKLIAQVPAFSPMFAPPRDVGSFFANLLLLQTFGLHDYLTWNAPSWSIAAEFWVYVFAAILFRFAGQRRTLILVPFTALSGVAMLLSGEPFLGLTYNGGALRCLYGFCIGSLACSVFERRPNRSATPSTGRALSTLWEGLVLLAVVAALCLLERGAITIGLPLLFGVCVLVLAQQGGVISTILSRRAPVWLGTISFSIYMTHQFVEGRVLDVLTITGQVLNVQTVERVVTDGVAKRVVIGSETFINLTITALLLLILAISFMSYRFIEQPCNRWARARIDRRSGRLVVSPAS